VDLQYKPSRRSSNVIAKAILQTNCRPRPPLGRRNSWGNTLNLLLQTWCVPALRAPALRAFDSVVGFSCFCGDDYRCCSKASVLGVCGTQLIQTGNSRTTLGGLDQNGMLGLCLSGGLTLYPMLSNPRMSGFWPSLPDRFQSNLQIHSEFLAQKWLTLVAFATILAYPYLLSDSR
jgi:hypothetical protein